MGQGRRVEIQTGAIFAGAMALLMLPLSFLFSFLIAAFVHELCHYLVLSLTGFRIYRVSIGMFGASMETDAMDPGREALCALAGPVGSFLMVTCYRFLPEIALCALIQGCFNLLPIYPLDGGRVLKGVLELLKIPDGEKVLAFVQWITGAALCVICIYGYLRWKLGLGVLFLGLMVLLRTLPRKTPCKDRLFGVQ